MIINFVSKVLNKLFICSPSVHYIKPKALNVFFKNSIFKNFNYINLENFDSISFYIEKIKEGDNVSFSLVFKGVEKGKSVEIELDEFNTFKEAEDALNMLKFKLYSVDKTLIKTSLVIAFLIVIWSFASDLAMINFNKNVAVMSSSGGQQQIQGVKQQEELNRLLSQLQQNQNQPVGQEPTNGKPNEEIAIIQNNPNVDGFLQSLKR